MNYALSLCDGEGILDKVTGLNDEWSIEKADFSATEINVVI